MLRKVTHRPTIHLKKKLNIPKSDLSHFLGDFPWFMTRILVHFFHSFFIPRTSSFLFPERALLMRGRGRRPDLSRTWFRHGEKEGKAGKKGRKNSLNGVCSPFFSFPFFLGSKWRFAWPCPFFPVDSKREAKNLQSLVHSRVCPITLVYIFSDAKFFFHICARIFCGRKRFSGNLPGRFSGFGIYEAGLLLPCLVKHVSALGRNFGKFSGFFECLFQVVWAKFVLAEIERWSVFWGVFRSGEGAEINLFEVPLLGKFGNLFFESFLEQTFFQDNIFMNVENW